MCVLRGVRWSVHECFRYTSTQDSVSTAPYFQAKVTFSSSGMSHTVVPLHASQMTDVVFPCVDH